MAQYLQDMMDERSMEKFLRPTDRIALIGDIQFAEGSK